MKYQARLRANIEHAARKIVGEPNNPLDMGNSIAMKDERAHIMEGRLLRVDEKLREMLSRDVWTPRQAAELRECIHIIWG